MSDRRRETSRANLGDHIPEALDPNGTIVVGVRLPRNMAAALDRIAERDGVSRSQVARDCIEYSLLKNPRTL